MKKVDDFNLWDVIYPPSRKDGKRVHQDKLLDAPTERGELQRHLEGHDAAHRPATERKVLEVRREGAEDGEELLDERCGDVGHRGKRDFALVDAWRLECVEGLRVAKGGGELLVAEHLAGDGRDAKEGRATARAELEADGVGRARGARRAALAVDPAGEARDRAVLQQRRE